MRPRASKLWSTDRPERAIGFYLLPRTTQKDLRTRHCLAGWTLGSTHLATDIPSSLQQHYCNSLFFALESMERRK